MISSQSSLNFDIDAIQLANIIQYFNEHGSPLHALTCGLLLEGRIENFTNDLHQAESSELRFLDAIDCYLKALKGFQAADEFELAAKVQHILWHIKTIYHEHATVIERLKQVDLSPMIESYSLFKAKENNVLCDIRNKK